MENLGKPVVKLEKTPVGLHIIGHLSDKFAGPEMTVAELAFQSLEGGDILSDNIKFYAEFVSRLSCLIPESPQRYAYSCAG
jgi:hypothetical protein